MKRLLFILALVCVPAYGQGPLTARMLSGTNVVTSCPYTIQATDQTKLLVLNAVSTCAVTLPAATTLNFGAGAIFSVKNQGGGNATITPASGTISGSSSLTLATGQGADIYSDGTNYQTQPGAGVGGGGGSPAGVQGDIQCNNTSFGNCSGIAENLKGDLISTGPNPQVDIRTQGARAVNPTVAPAVTGITATCIGSTATVAISSASSFQNGDGVVLQGCGAATGMSTPSAPTVTPSLAAAPPGTGVVVSAPAGGSTTTCYKYADRDKGQGLTVASGETCATGQSLGQQTLSITSSSISNNILTFTTAARSPELLAVGMYFCMAGTTADSIYGGCMVVATVPSNTTFTVGPVASDTRNGVTASATGGTMTYWRMNHVAPPTAGTNVWQHIYYSGATGAETFDGIGLPVNSSLSPDGSYQVWDDLGSPYTTAPVRPWFIPNSPPASAVADSLVTTIASGAGTTTLTLTVAPTTSVGTTPILYEFGQNIKSAFTAAQTANAMVYVPVVSSTNAFVVNAFTDLTGFNNTGASVAGQLYLNDTLNIRGDWTGEYVRGNLTNPQFSYSGFTTININSAYPGVRISPNGLIQGFNFQVAGNQYNAVYLENPSNIPTLRMENCAFTGSGASDYSGVNFIAFGKGTAGSNPAGLIFKNIVTNSNQGNSATSQWMIKNFGEINFDGVVGSGRGFYIGQLGTGTNLDYNGRLEIQAMSTPFFTAYGGSAATAINFYLENIVEDTGAMPIIAALTANVTASLSNVSSPSSGIPSVSGIALSKVAGYSSTVNGEAVNYGTLSDGIFNAPTQAQRGENVHVAVGQGYSLFTNPGTPVAPVCTVVSAGPPFTLAGTWTFNYTASYPNGGTSPVSANSNSCTANGTSQQIQIAGTAMLGATSYTWTQSTNFLTTNSSGCAGAVFPTTISFTWTGSVCGFATQPTVAGGGPAGLRNGLEWFQTGLTGQYLDYVGSASAPSNPASGNCRQYFNTTTGQMAFLNSSGASCNGAGPGTGTANAVADWATSSTLGSIVGTVTGQALTAANGSAPSFLSPGIADGNGGSAVTTTPYTIQCDSGTAIVDRAHFIRFNPGSSAVTIPLSTATGCTGNFVTSVANSSGGNLVFTPTSPDTLVVYTGNSFTTPPTFTLTPGQYATLTQGSSGIWEVRITTSGGVNAAAPLTATVYLSPNCPPTSTTAPCIYTPANTVIESTCNWTTSSTTINCTGANFTSTASTSQIAFGLGSCDPDQSVPAGGEITTTHVTVTGITDATHLTISANPANAVASAGCFVHGTPDDTGAANVDAALNGFTACPKIEMAAGGYMFTTFHFLGNPTACANLGSNGGINQGNIILANGEELEGRGPGPTVWYLPPDFPESGSCVNGVGTDACWAPPLLAYWHHFSIASNINNGMPASKALISFNLGQLDYFSCYDVGQSSSGSVGLEINYWLQGNNVNLAACGATNVVDKSNAIGMFQRLDLEAGSQPSGAGTAAVSLQVNGWLTCFHCEFLGSPTSITAPITVAVNGGGTGTFPVFNCKSCIIGTSPVVGLGSSSTFPIGMRVNGTSGSNIGIHLEDTSFVNTQTSGTGNTEYTAIQNNQASGSNANIVLDHVTLNHGSSGFSINDNSATGAMTIFVQNEGGAGGTLSSLDPTGFGFGFTNAAVNLIAPGHTLQGVCTGTATASSTLGLYGTGSNETLSTCTSTTIGNGVVMSQPTTLSTLFCTSTATTVSVACKVLVNGSASTITCTMTAATSCGDVTHTVSLNKGDLVSIEITTGAAETGANIKAWTIWNP